MLKNGNKRANGGKRAGAGRKKKAYTLLRERIIEASVDEARKSFDFLIQLRDNTDEPTGIRKEAALSILDRVLGKPGQSVAISMTWRDKARELGYDPDQIIHQVATTVAAVGLGSSDTGANGNGVAGEAELGGS